MSEENPSVVRSIAVTVDDVVAAYEANRQTDADAVLRVTPPFSGRMRARLHRIGPGGAPEPSVYVRPAALLAPSAPDYPRPDDTGDELRADPEVEYTRERHRERHRAAVAAWADAAGDHLVERVALRTPDGRHEVAVTGLG